ncbi:transglutaminase family protein [Nitrospirillum sp. BR 11752]|uniref:transglutaminase family protein n=1 Tax=Nitrospirillum sp. BR 11752 TaxID=3104293 RepID=UPI002EBB52C5|nr:transglutaminase family protein [Nitrospirillum sp. BR 11752]
MSIHVAINHKTIYRYDRLINLGAQLVRLRPAPHCRTPILSYSLKVTPKQHFLNWQQDPQSNWLARLVFPEKTEEFTLEVDLVADMAVINPFDFFLEPAAEKFPFTYEPWLAKDLKPFLEAEEPGPLVQSLLDGIDRTPTGTVAFLADLNLKLQQRIGYVIRLEPGVQTPEETLALGTGSCRDTAWLLVQVLRNLGLAARFASGYLVQLVADQKPLEGPDGPSADFTDLHAWTEVYLPGAGWIGLDPTSGLFAGEGHIPLACTPDPFSAAPVTGGLDMCEVTFEHAMSVTRIREQPRTTKPYTPDQWGAIDRLGHQVDREIVDGDIRLTMGGEPTFISIDDMEGAEWNTAALGPTKRLLSGDLIRRLQARYAQGGLLHFGQGKWYPGESLPRWALQLYWRRDGDALWTHGEYLADERRHYGYGLAESEAFIRRLAERLGIDPDYARGAFEDPWHYIRKERELPVNVDPFDSKLEDAEERARLAKVFETGLGTPVGYALPVQRRHEASGPVWLSSAWATRSDRLLLAPGDSPIGYRLPLGSLPWVDAIDRVYSYEQDPFDSRPDLPAREELEKQMALRKGQTEPLRQRLMADVRDRQDKVPEKGASAWWLVRTALCVQPRDGRLYIFLPPTSYLEDWIELVTQIEATCVDLDLAVVLEGYPPPRDPRLNSIAVTPDPGVIEVNIHPASNWTDLVYTTTTLYEDARQTRLGTEKFALDGRHVGTGGGNHVVVGGPTPADSPFLRRPDVLRSLLTYFQNHPSLSYLFSTMFIGPTSQHPRVDEARHESLYELEIAFKELDRAGPNPPPWLVDRALRHLLVDVQGNTHRSEFCIDKLYSPDSSTGRLGLVELRSFEMPPHAQMSLVQQLLLRTLIAWFWREPYRAGLVRWGTKLHDRFLLPQFVTQDIQDVVTELREAGYAFEESWFAPHLNFRFPKIGAVSQRSLSLELRTALEPWHVLGEEPGGGGTVRYVDSSLERIQVRMTGMVGDRYAVTCNGRRLPLHPTGTEGEYVAAVRYRAWQPPGCLHPTIPVHTPLVFDILDLWTERSVGGCTYHVAHPGGRNFTTFPVNANEAEGRRLARFHPFGHTPGPMTIPPETRNPDYPMTLDLRLG